jgi:hypothetical protein
VPDKASKYKVCVGGIYGREKRCMDVIFGLEVSFQG